HDLSYIIFMQAAAGAIVEEMVCRGLLMGYIEKKTNIRIAIIVTSLFFGVIHLLNGALNVTSFFLLLVSGTLVGMMFG
ncbi:CPBP family intramembrane glutamic endopeptidase, partial [Staphylococcus epidermidis]|uniref:CPBP family intramembrane glutamic endopeptidase n=2 Tax=Staphylococcus TaxID=1279 RepID=UPI0030BD1C7D